MGGMRHFYITLAFTIATPIVATSIALIHMLLLCVAFGDPITYHNMYARLPASVVMLTVELWLVMFGVVLFGGKRRETQPTADV